MHPNQLRESAPRVQTKISQAIGLHFPFRQTWINSPALYRYYSARKTPLQTVTLLSTSLGMNEYIGTLYWKSTALMSASSAIRSARKAVHLFAELGGQVLLLTWLKSSTILGWCNCVPLMSRYANNVAPGLPELYSLDNSASKRRRVEEIEKRSARVVVTLSIVVKKWLCSPHNLN
jgi:hypothetical protein